MSTFFSELRRRKVYGVAAAYAVGAWLIIQISATVVPMRDPLRNHPRFGELQRKHGGSV